MRSAGIERLRALFSALQAGRHIARGFGFAEPADPIAELERLAAEYPLR